MIDEVAALARRWLCAGFWRGRPSRANSLLCQNCCAEGARDTILLAVFCVEPARNINIDRWRCLRPSIQPMRCHIAESGVWQNCFGNERVLGRCASLRPSVATNRGGARSRWPCRRAASRHWRERRRRPSRFRRRACGASIWMIPILIVAPHERASRSRLIAPRRPSVATVTRKQLNLR